MNDPYQTLGVSRTATEDEISKAYKKLAMMYHPDRNPGDKSAEERFKEINAARDAIKNGEPEAPSRGFDAGVWRFNFGHGSGFGNLDEILAALHAQHNHRNRDITVECRISLEDAFQGSEVTVNVHTQNDIRNISVKIPAGIEDGNRIKVAQAGEHSFPSMTPGDLYITVHVNAHAKFHRQSSNLLAQIEVDLFDILIGGIGKIQGIDGNNLEVKIPVNFNPETQLKLVGQGMPSPASSQRGDLLLSIKVIYPTLSIQQRELIFKVRSLGHSS